MIWCLRVASKESRWNNIGHGLLVTETLRCAHVRWVNYIIPLLMCTFEMCHNTKLLIHGSKIRLKRRAFENLPPKGVGNWAMVLLLLPCWSTPVIEIKHLSLWKLHSYILRNTLACCFFNDQKTDTNTGARVQHHKWKLPLRGSFIHSFIHALQILNVNGHGEMLVKDCGNRKLAIPLLSSPMSPGGLCYF